MVLSEVTTSLIFLFFGGAVLLAGRLMMARWWRSALGVMTAYTVSAYVLTGGLAVTTAVLGRDYAGREFVRVLAWGIVAFIPWGQLLVFVGVQRRGEREKRDHEQDHLSS